MQEMIMRELLLSKQHPEVIWMLSYCIIIELLLYHGYHSAEINVRDRNTALIEALSKLSTRNYKKATLLIVMGTS